MSLRKLHANDWVEPSSAKFNEIEFDICRKNCWQFSSFECMSANNVTFVSDLLFVNNAWRTETRSTPVHSRLWWSSWCIYGVQLHICISILVHSFHMNEINRTRTKQNKTKMLGIRRSTLADHVDLTHTKLWRNCSNRAFSLRQWACYFELYKFKPRNQNIALQLCRLIIIIYSVNGKTSCKSEFRTNETSVCRMLVLSTALCVCVCAWVWMDHITCLCLCDVWVVLPVDAVDTYLC